jgi:cytoskeletal protein CcmA (bactofilin family)
MADIIQSCLVHNLVHDKTYDEEEVFAFEEENGMNHARKFLSVLVLAAWLALTFSTPAYAFDGRGGDKVVIEAGEVVDDDLYVGAQEFVLDGTVNGDLIVFGQTVTINGKVDGDLMTAAQTVAVNGEVTGSIRMAGSILFVGEKASIGGDIVGAGYSFEGRPGSTIGQDLVFAGGQILLAGDVTRNVQVATGGFDLRGAVGGDVQAEVGEADRGNAGPPPTLFMPHSTIAAPTVRPGLTIEAPATIAGDLKYSQSKDVNIPAGVVNGKVTRTPPTRNANAPLEETSAQKITKWGLNFVRTSITLILVGLLLLWLFPFFVRGLSDQLQAHPLPSLGWGAVAWAAFFFVLMLIVAATILGGLLFGLLTLGQLTGAVIWLGLLALVGLILMFALVTTFIAKVVFGAALGKWILLRANSPLAEHRYWPMVVGVLITVIVTALLSFPLMPGLLGWLVNFAIVLLGLGALWLWSRERMIKRAVVS